MVSLISSPMQEVFNINNYMIIKIVSQFLFPAYYIIYILKWIIRSKWNHNRMFKILTIFMHVFKLDFDVFWASLICRLKKGHKRSYNPRFEWWKLSTIYFSKKSFFFNIDIYIKKHNFFVCFIFHATDQPFI